MQPAAPDRPFFEVAMQRIMERRTRVELLFRQACDHRIAVFDTLLIDDPYPQAVTGKSRGNSIGYGIDVVQNSHIHHDAAARRQPRTQGVAGLVIEFIVELKAGTTDIDGDAVVKRVVVIDEFAEIGDHAWQIIRQSKELMRDHEADRVVVDDRQPFAQTGQPGGKGSAAASQHEDLFRARQKLFHELDIGEYALTVGRRLTLPHTLFEIDAGSVPRTFDDLDLAVPALIAPQQPHGRQPYLSRCIK